MIRIIAAVAALALLAACGDKDAADPGADPGVAPEAVAPVSPDPAPSTPATTAPPSADPSDSPNAGGLDSALADVQRVAPRLEGYYRSGTYPKRLDEVVASLPEAGLELSPGSRLGAYRYDADAVEFTLCVEHTSGAFATYDTAPMATGKQGEEGGCPAL